MLRNVTTRVIEDRDARKNEGFKPFFVTLFHEDETEVRDAIKFSTAFDGQHQSPIAPLCLWKTC
jgi:hypothetical protein